MWRFIINPLARLGPCKPRPTVGHLCLDTSDLGIEFLVDSCLDTASAGLDISLDTNLDTRHIPII